MLQDTSLLNNFWELVHLETPLPVDNLCVLIPATADLKY